MLPHNKSIVNIIAKKYRRQLRRLLQVGS
jgi:hypothetical protein